MWILYSFISAFSETAKDIIGKNVTPKTGDLIASLFLQAIAAVVLAPLLLLTEIPALKLPFYFGLISPFFFAPLITLLYLRALHLSPLSSTMPLLALNPVFTLIISVVFWHQEISLLGLLGILVIVVGIYFVRLNNISVSGLLKPFSSMLNDQGSLSMLTVALLMSVSVNINKAMVLGSSPLIYAFSETAIGAFVTWLMIQNKKDIWSSFKKHHLPLSGLGVLNGVSELALGQALAAGFPSYVIVIKRTSMVWSSIAGKLFYKETFNRYKVIGLLSIIIGVGMVVFS